MLTGLGYALPWYLFPGNTPEIPIFGHGILNLYCLVAWMGLAHFIYAYRGQLKALRRPGFPVYRFITCVGVGVLALLWLRHALGWILFSFVMWIYFIPHFMNALIHFNRTSQTPPTKARIVLYWFPALAFAVFTFAVFGLQYYPMTLQPFILLGTVLLSVLAGWLGGIFSQLRNRSHSSVALLAFVFLGEAFVWGSYSRYMNP